MTVDELKEEAKKLGYNVIKRQERIKLKPCKCGRKRIDQWIDWIHREANIYYKCPQCGRQSEKCETEREARIAWNDMVESEKN